MSSDSKTTTAPAADRQPVAPENPFVSLVFNIVLPTLILTKLSSPDRLGAKGALLVGLAFPLAYGIYDFIKRRKYSFISILGFTSIILTGGLGLLELDGIWFAVKEATIPALICIALLVSLRTPFPLVRKLIYNDALIHVERIDSALDQRGTRAAFESSLLASTYLIALSFAVSAVINFFLAVILLKSPAGTPEFTEELGFMTAISYPIILICCSSLMVFALWRLVKRIKELTGLEFDAIFKGK